MVFPPDTVRRSALTAAGLVLLLCLLPVSAAAVMCMTAEPLFQINSADGTALRQPSDLTVDEGRLYVLDDLNGRIVRYRLDGTYAGAVALPPGSGSSYLGMDLGGDDNFYLAASKDGKIIVLNQSGKTLTSFMTGAEGSVSEPVAVDVSRGSCFVADNEEHKVKVFDLDGNLMGEWGGLGERPQQFRYPFRVIQDSQGRVIVTDSLNSRIKVFTPKGELLLDFGDFGVVEGTLFRPAGIGLWGNDRILVSDNYLGSVQLFDLTGAYRAVLCDSGGTPLLFRNPASLAASGTTLFVLETGASRVQALRVGAGGTR